MQKIILLVEDNEDSRELMKYMIKSFGHRVIVAENGLEALELAEQEPFDLILMDISMPMMDGITVVKIIKQHKPIAKVPIIAVTAHSQKYRDEVIAAGAVELLVKPVDSDDLKVVLEKYL